MAEQRHQGTRRSGHEPGRPRQPRGETGRRAPADVGVPHVAGPPPENEPQPVEPLTGSTPLDAAPPAGPVTSTAPNTGPIGPISGPEEPLPSTTPSASGPPIPR